MTATSETRSEMNRIEAAPETSLYGLLPALRRLDERLKLVLIGAGVSVEHETDAQPFPGLWISRNELGRLLEREPGETAFAPALDLFQEPLFDSTDNSNPYLARLLKEYNLSPFDMDIVLIALAPELDLRYERIFGYLQDDITYKRPSVDLALNLLCPSAGVKESRRAHFADSAPLIRNNLLQLVQGSDQPRPELAYQLRLERQVINLVMGLANLDAGLSSFCRLIDPTASLAAAPISIDLKRALPTLLAQSRETGQPIKLYFHGPRGAGKHETAEALAAQMNSPLLIVEMEQAILSATDFDRTLKLIFREARFRKALLYLENFDALLEEERATPYRRFLKIVDEDRGAIVLASAKPPAAKCEYSIKSYKVHFPVQNFQQRRTCWDENLRRHGVMLGAEELETLAGGFRLTNGEIVAAIAAAIDLARLRAASRTSPETLTHEALPQPTANELFASARARLSHNLSSFARKIEPKYVWADIVLPVDQLAQLREICNQYKYQQVVYGEWGFGRKLSLGKGLNVLFSGHPGTGKTMAAEVIAGELHLDLYKIDLSQVVNKYIGETEKSLNRIFSEAQASSSILFFDEADALFGKRTEVKDSHDRYANIEVSYLLQKMEEYDGIAILATNLRQNMDEAFLRRMQFIVELPFPDEESRRRIWEVLFPREAPIASDVDFSLLAREVRLAGGNLKNIGLAAAFYAADDGRVIRQQHLVRAVRREFQKMGRSWSERDWKIEEDSIPADVPES